MVKPEVESLQERKVRLSMESDTLRYHLGWQCAELAGPASKVIQGVQLATRLQPVFSALSSRHSPAKKRSKLIIVAKLLSRMIQG